MKLAYKNNVQIEKNTDRRHGIWFVLVTLLTFTFSFTAHADGVVPINDMMRLAYLQFDGDRKYTLRIPVKLHHLRSTDSFRVICEIYDESMHKVPNYGGFTMRYNVPISGEVNTVFEIGIRHVAGTGFPRLDNIATWKCSLVVNGKDLYSGLNDMVKSGPRYMPRLVGHF